MKILTLKEREKEHIRGVLVQTSWDLGKAAALLRIPLSRLKRKIVEYQLEPGDSPDRHATH